MHEPRLMPERDKYKHALGMVRLYQERILPFVEYRLGQAARHELVAELLTAITPIRGADPADKKYAAAYRTWMWMARCTHDFLAERLRREEVAAYKRLLLQQYTHQHDNTSLFIQRHLGNHEALTKAWTYQMQWMTPLEITCTSQTETICMVQNCKIRHLNQAIRICGVDCQNVGKALARNLYHLERINSITDHTCTITLTAL